MNELRKIIKSNKIIIIIAIVVIVFLSINLIYVLKAINVGNESINSIQEYHSFDELKNRINVIDSALSNTTLEPYQIRTLNWEKSIYSILLENKIVYSDFKYDANIDLFALGSFRYSFFVVTLMNVLTLFIIAFVIVDIFDSDFLHDTYKYVYTRNSSRRQILRNKMIASGLITLAIALLYLISMLIINLFFKSDYTYILLRNDANEAFIVKESSYVLMSYLSFIFDIALFYILFISISIFSKRYILNLIICFVLIVICLLLSGTKVFVFDEIFLTGNTMLSNGYSYINIFIGYLIRFSICIPMIPISIFIFNRRDLC